MKFVSYYTDKYKRHADTLGASLKKLGLRYELDLVRDLGSWKANTALKPSFLRRKLDECAREEAICWIDVDATVHTAPALFYDLAKAKTELAVYRHVSSTPYHASDWHNFGEVWNGTIFLRVSPFMRKVLDEWIREEERHPERLEQKNLATVLAKADPAHLYCLPPTYCWVEQWMRPLSPKAVPVIEHFMVGEHGKRVPSQKPPPAGPEVLWCGHLYGNTGYAKSNREVMLRVAQTLKVGISREGITEEQIQVDDYTKARLDVHLRTMVSDKAPLVRFYTPREENPLDSRYKICWTMLETHPGVHPEFIRLLNDNYNEVWVPTRDGLRTFIASGLTVASRVMPLGVNYLTYRRRGEGKPQDRPKARLLTGKRAGAMEVPEGTGYLTVCQPTFRKGLDVLVAAWAMADRKDASLVIYTGEHSKLDAWGADPWRYVTPKKCKARIYHLAGRRTEPEMARLYQSMDVYVTATLGEGFNMPLLEAASCGLPVIAPLHTAHVDFLDEDNSTLIEPDRYGPIPYAKKISPWYDGQSFAQFGTEAMGKLKEAFKFKGPLESSYPLRMAIAQEYNWDHVARLVTQRILEVAPKEDS